MSELFKIKEQALTQGYSLRLTKHKCRLDIRKNFFTSRVVNAWNFLTGKVVCAPSVIAFGNHLDKQWYMYNHPMRFNPDIEYNPNPRPNPHMKTHDPGSQRSAEIQIRN